MPQDIQFTEAADWPLCPHCEQSLEQIEYRKQKMSFGFMSGFEWIIVLSCPHCRKAIGTTNR